MFGKNTFMTTILVLVCFLPIKIEGGVWRYARKPPFGSTLQDVFFIPNSSVIWAVGWGWIGESIDAGKTWEARSISGDLWGVWFRNLSDGLACGYNGIVLKTTDSGNTWNQIGVSIPDDLIRISFWDDSVGLIVGGVMYPESGTILRTTNFGETWQTVYSGSELCTDVKCVQGSDWAWVSLTAPTGQTNVLKTTNKGLTWQQTAIPGGAEYGYSIDATNDGQTAWLVAWYSGDTKVYKTTNGGISWNFYDTPDLVGPWEMKFIDSMKGWMVCGAMDLGGIANVLRTTDGGVTWITCVHPGHEPLYSVAFLDQDTLISVGGCFGGTVIRSTDAGINWDYITQAEGINAFAAVDTEYIWAVGDYATVLRSTNGGDTWENQRALEPDIYGGTFWTVSFPNRNVGYVSGSAYFVQARTRKTVDGGYSWFQPACNGLPNQAVTDVKFVSADLGWFLLIDGRIYKTVDGADNWSLQYQPSGAGDWDALDFVDSLYGWACGEVISQGKIVIATTDGGNNWTTQMVSSADWSDIDFIDRNKGWAIGGTTFIRTTDGGDNWNSIALLNSGYGVGFGDSLCGWVNGTTILHTNDGGLTFFTDTIEQVSEVLPPEGDMGRYIYYPRVVAIDSGHAWCSLGQMNDGKILKYFPSISEIKEGVTVKITSSLFKISPNPFSTSLKVEFELIKKESVLFSLYDKLGREVAMLFKGELSTGTHHFAWNVDDLSFRQCPSGIYFLKLQTNDKLLMQKCVLLKR